MNVTKVPPLVCPNCNSINVMKHHGVIDCYDCEYTTAKSGKKKHKQTIYRRPGRGYDPNGPLGTFDKLNSNHRIKD